MKGRGGGREEREKRNVGGKSKGIRGEKNVPLTAISK